MVCHRKRRSRFGIRFAGRLVVTARMGRDRTRQLAILTALFVVLVSLALAGCGGGGGDGAAEEPPAATADEGGGTEGNAEAGAQLFADNGCGNCHTLEAAGTTGTTGPNLDELQPSSCGARRRSWGGWTASSTTSGSPSRRASRKWRTRTGTPCGS